MTWHSAYIGDYYIRYDDEAETNPIIVNVIDNAKQKYSSIPTAAECNEALETSGRLLNIGFFNCQNMKASPELPEEVNSFGSSFEKCYSLSIAPKLPKTSGQGYIGYYRFGFNYCSSLLIPATIPTTAKNVAYMYRDATALRNAASIPKDVINIYRTYSGCTSLEGEFCIRTTSVTDNSYALADTINTITIYGDKDLCEAVAATANNGNASWQPWYEPVPAVTDRGQGSYTTAEDMTRIVRNGVLAVDSYAPGRMVYHQGDIVREDEWEALVEAAQTIDPTVTMSTHYTNLNKIEKAFDDAL